MYYNENTIIYFNGEFIKATEARSNVYDQSLHYGYAAFEGIRSYVTDNGTRIFKAQEHYDRLKFSCEVTGIPYPFDNGELIELSYEVLDKNGLGDAYLRPLVSCSPNMGLTTSSHSKIMIAAWQWNAYLGDKLLNLCTSSYRRISPASFKVEAKISGHYVNSILAAQEAKDRGFDEALLLDADGFVAEGPGANIFIEKDGKLLTPQKGSILPGITRATVIEICEVLDIDVIEKRISPSELFNADSAFYCGTAAEIIGVASVDKKPFGLPWKDSIGSIIQKAYHNLVLEKSYSSAETAA
jgi:branched-chain amino acid aminotransferase